MDDNSENKGLTMSMLTERAIPGAMGDVALDSGLAIRERAVVPTFALVTISHQGQFFKQLTDGAKAAAARAGVELLLFDASDTPAGQNSAIETCTRCRMQGIIVIASDVNGVMPAVQAAAAAGIPVVAVDALLPPGRQKTQIGVDNGKGGGMIGWHFLDHAAKAGGEAVVGIVCALNSSNQIIRARSFADVVSGKPGINLAGTVDGHDILEISISAAQMLLTERPDLTALYATGELALLGAMAAVERLGRQERVKLFGWDLNAQVIRGIDAGVVVAVAQQDPAGMGGAAVIALTTLNKGGSVERTITVPVNIITRANVDPYRAVFK
jgi:ribose transport system substrate-binding protein